MSFTRVAAVADLPPDEGRTVTINGRKLGLFFSGGAYFVLDNECTHRGAPLHEGFCENGEVTCPWHDARFNLATGAALCPPAVKAVRSYPVRVVGDELQADL